MKKSLMALLLAFCMFAMAACVPGQEAESKSEAPAPTTESTGTTAPAPAEEKVLKLSMVGEPSNLDPHSGSTTATSMARTPIYEGLVIWQNGKIAPGVAETWEISDDGLVYTFHLRDNATWWDGEPVTAQNFVDGFTRLIDPNGPNGGYAFYGYWLVNGEAYNKGEITDESEVGVKALDDYTLEITLNQNVPYFLSTNAAGFFSPIRQEIADEYGLEYGTSVEKVMGNGPYKITEWAHENQLIFEKNEDYWNADAVNLDEVQLLIIPDGNTALNMYENGELDLALVPSAMVPKYVADGKAEYIDTGVEYWLEFNVAAESEAAPFLANANFRHAIGWALDRQGYVNAVYNNGSMPALKYTPNIMMMGDKPWGEIYTTDWYAPNADADKAKECLELALKELGKTAADIPTIGFLTSDTPESKLSAEAIQDMLSTTLGLNIEIELVQSKQRFEMMTAGDFDIVFAGYGPDYNDPMAWLERLQSFSGLNDTNFDDAEYDALIAEAAVTADEAKRADLLVKAEDIMKDRGPLVPMYMKTTVWTKADYVKNVTTGVISDMEFNFLFADIEK